MRFVKSSSARKQTPSSSVCSTDSKEDLKESNVPELALFSPCEPLASNSADSEHDRAE